MKKLDFHMSSVGITCTIEVLNYELIFIFFSVNDAPSSFTETGNE